MPCFVGLGKAKGVGAGRAKRKSLGPSKSRDAGKPLTWGVVVGLAKVKAFPGSIAVARRKQP